MTCPYCGATLDAVTGITGVDLPAPGDPSLCAYCAGLLVFDLQRRPREPDEAELAALLRNVHLMTAQRALREAIRRRPPT